jgi:hypothetical protein
MYADDSTIHISGKNISDIQTKVQEDFNRIELWCKDNNMFINCNNIECITLGKKEKLALYFRTDLVNLVFLIRI